MINLVTAISGDINNVSEKTRAIVYKYEPKAEWSAKEILITVKT